VATTTASTAATVTAATATVTAATAAAAILGIGAGAMRNRVWNQYDGRRQHACNGNCQ
jgi:hypothetical protein